MFTFTKRQIILFICAPILGSLTFFLLLSSAVPEDNLAIINHTVRTNSSDNRILTVTLRNNADYAYAYAVAEISFINKNDAVVDHQALKIENLNGGQTWTPEFTIIHPEAIKFRIEKLRWRSAENRDIAIGPYKAIDISTQ